MASALVVIDLQEGMQAEKGAYDGAGVIERIAGMLDRARKSGMKIIYVQHDGGAEPGHPLAKGTPGHAIHHAIAPKAGEAIVIKTQCSAFLGTTMGETLKKAGIDQTHRRPGHRHRTSRSTDTAFRIITNHVPSRFAECGGVPGSWLPEPSSISS